MGQKPPPPLPPHSKTENPVGNRANVQIRQRYERNGEMKVGRIGITITVAEFNKLVKLIPKVQDSIGRYELRDTGIFSSPFELDLPVLDLNTVFLPSPPSQELITVNRDEELLDRQPKCPLPPSTLNDVLPPSIDPSLENDLNDLNFYGYVSGEKRKRYDESPKKKDKKPKTESKSTVSES